MGAVREGRVCVFGAGGPVGAKVYEALRGEYAIRFADIVPAEAVAAKPFNPKWPGFREVPPPPHEWVLADITDLEQVERALAGCAAVINLAVNRSDPAGAFWINTVGTWNVLRAAGKLGLGRVINTGPVNVAGLCHEGDERFQFGITEEAPLRCGMNLYGITKRLGMDACAAFAEHHGIEVLTLLVSRLRPHDDYDGRDDDVAIPFSVAWEDLGESFRCALRAGPMPGTHETFFICARMPMEQYLPDKAERLLGWKARHTFERFCERPSKAG